MNNQSGVYTITHISSGKQYVGSAVNMASRRRDHWKALRKGDHDNSKLQHAWNKYGESAFEFVPLCTCRPEDLTTCEQVAMDHLEPFYNILRVAGSSLGYKHTDEVKIVLSKLRKGKPGTVHTDEAKQKIREANTGRIFSPEHLDNLSKSHQGTTASDETRRRMSESHHGFRHTPDSIEIMRQKALARAPFSPEHLENMSKAQRGKKRGPLSPEHCAKISVALTGKKRAVPSTPCTGGTISCVICGALRYVQKYRLATAKYCSRECSYEGRHREHLAAQQVITSREPITITQEAE